MWKISRGMNTLSRHCRHGDNEIGQNVRWLAWAFSNISIWFPITVCKALFISRWQSGAISIKFPIAAPQVLFSGRWQPNAILTAYLYDMCKIPSGLENFFYKDNWDAQCDSQSTSWCLPENISRGNICPISAVSGLLLLFTWFTQ